MNDQSEQKFLERSRATFDRSVAELDPAVCARLARARRAALANIAQPASRHLAWGWLPAGAVASIAVGLFVTLLWIKPAPDHPVALIAENSADLDILLAEDDLDLYADLEFYTWLDSQPDGV